MLKALYDYGIRNNLTLRQGFEKTPIKAYVLLDSNGNLLDLESNLDDNGRAITVTAPDIGNAKVTKEKCNVLVEKKEIVIPDKENPKNTIKSNFFLNVLKDNVERVPDFAAVVNALENNETMDKIRFLAKGMKLKDADKVSFKVNGKKIFECDGFDEWWQEFFKSMQKRNSSSGVPCLITGEISEPMRTTPKIKGLNVVGGQASGDALICFDKNAFRSYNLEQAENAPVSEKSYSTVKFALDDLIEKSPRELCNVKFVHWFSEKIDNDPIVPLIFIPEEPDDDDSADNDNFQLSFDKLQNNAQEGATVKIADNVVQKIGSGEKTTDIDNIKYYILMLSANNGRIIVRHYEQGNYSDLRQNIEKFNSQIELVTPDGADTLKPRSIYDRFKRLLSFRNQKLKDYDRMRDELSGICTPVICSIIDDTPIPDSVNVRALSYVRSGILSDQTNILNDGPVWQWIKLWLVRNRKKEITYMYNPDYDSVSYHMGAMLAIYEKIQSIADPAVNVTVVDRFYSSAIQTPALVLGRLSAMSVHHLAKLSDGLATFYKMKLAEESEKIEGKIPTTLTLEQQSEFALGYYQKIASLSKEAAERKAAKKTSSIIDNQIHF